MGFRLIIHGCLTLLIFSCNNKPNSGYCARFRNGEFIMHSPQFNTTWKFIRKDSIQTEINLTNGNTQTFEVKWINECEHTLRYLSATSTDSFASENERIIQSHVRSIISHMRIVTTGKNYYLVMAEKKGDGKFLSDTIWEASAYRGSRGLTPIGDVIK